MAVFAGYQGTAAAAADVALFLCCATTVQPPPTPQLHLLANATLTLQYITYVLEGILIVLLSTVLLV